MLSFHPAHNRGSIRDGEEGRLVKLCTRHAQLQHPSVADISLFCSDVARCALNGSTQVKQTICKRPETGECDGLTIARRLCRGHDSATSHACFVLCEEEICHPHMLPETTPNRRFFRSAPSRVNYCKSHADRTLRSYHPFRSYGTTRIGIETEDIGDGRDAVYAFSRNAKQRKG